DVPAHRIIDLLLPVNQDRSRDMAQVVIRRRIVVDLDDPHGLVADVALHPARVDQDFGTRVIGHGMPLRAFRSITPLYSLCIWLFRCDYSVESNRRRRIPETPSFCYIWEGMCNPSPSYHDGRAHARPAPPRFPR